MTCLEFSGCKCVEKCGIYPCKALKAYNKALDDFREMFADRVTYDEEVVYVDSDECIAVSRGSVKRLVDKLVKEMKH